MPRQALAVGASLAPGAATRVARREASGSWHSGRSRCRAREGQCLSARWAQEPPWCQDTVHTALLCHKQAPGWQNWARESCSFTGSAQRRKHKGRSWEEGEEEDEVMAEASGITGLLSPFASILGNGDQWGSAWERGLCSPVSPMTSTMP